MFCQDSSRVGYLLLLDHLVELAFCALYLLLQLVALLLCLLALAHYRVQLASHCLQLSRQRLLNLLLLANLLVVALLILNRLVLGPFRLIPGLHRRYSRLFCLVALSNRLLKLLLKLRALDMRLLDCLLQRVHS